MKRNNIRNTQDFVRVIQSFNGMTDGTRKVVVHSHHDEGETTLSVTEKGDTMTITMPHIPASASESDLDYARSYVYERVAGFLHSGGMYNDLEERGVLKRKDGSASPLASITTALEGVRASREFGTDYVGTRKGLARAQEQRLDALGEAIARADGPLSKEAAAYAACEYMASSMLEDWSHGVSQAQEAFEREAPDDVLKNVEKLVDAGLRDELLDAKSYTDTRDIARRAFELLLEKTEEEEQQQCQQQQEGGDDEEGGNSDGNEGGDLDPMVEATGREPAEADGERPDPSKDRDDSEDGEPCIGSDGVGDFIPTPDDQVIVCDFPRGVVLQGLGGSPLRGGLPTEGHYRVSNRVNDTGLANDVRRVIQVRSAAHWVGGKKRGRLQRKNLYRIGVPTVGDGEWNARFRRTREQSTTLDTSVMLLIDYSGSMSGRKIEIAMECARAVASVLSTIRVPFACHGFTTGGCNHKHLIFKEFGDTYVPKNFVSYLERGSCMLNNNEDYKGIDIAARALLAQKSRRKILIVLSDGEPAACRDGCQETAMTALIPYYESMGVEFVGFGIKSSAVSKFYKQNYVVHDVEQLSAAVLATMKAKLV